MNNQSEMIIRINKAKYGNIMVENLYDYFNGFDFSVADSRDEYILKLKKSDYCYCEDMSESLANLGIKQKEINDFIVSDRQMSLCFSESWVSYAWREFCSMNEYHPKNITILHIDDHSDLMPPFIIQNDDCFTNMLNGSSIHIDSPVSLRAVIESGAITIGSCLTPIVFDCEQVKVIHIKQNSHFKKFSLAKGTCSDDLLTKNGNNRICIDIVEQTQDSKNIYLRTSNFKEAEKEFETGDEVFIHIDMDYFNNRFNGSTSWWEESCIHNPDIEKQKEKIIELCKFISDISDIVNIKYLVIGISPSFYPCEYWSVGVPFLLDELNKAGISSEAISKIFRNTVKR